MTSARQHAQLLHLATRASLAVAITLVIAKAIAWAMSGSVSLLAGLTDSLLDSAASLLNLLAVRYALKPADEDHRYGHGKAEDVLGRALHGRQEQVVVATKVRLAAEEMHDVAGAVRTSVEASLRRLRREMVDVLHVHNRFTPRRGDLPHALRPGGAPPGV